MTVKELMETVDRLHANQFSNADKLRWLNQVEAILWHEVIDTHADAPESGLPTYTEAAETTVLLAEDPWSRLYPLWMDAQIAYYNRETMKYDTAAAAFNSALGDWRNWYNRHHMPIGAVDHLHLVDRTWGWA